MKSSETPSERARRLLHEIAALLDQAAVERLIDDPVDAAAESFPCALSMPKSHRQFHAIAGEFVVHIYQHLPSCPRTFSPAQAAACALSLLEMVYGGGGGYGAALLDAFHPDRGLPLVLAYIAEAIKAQLRHEHRQWAYCRCLDLVDQATRRALATLLMGDCTDLPRATSAMPNPRPEDMVHLLHELLEGHLKDSEVHAGAGWETSRPR